MGMDSKGVRSNIRLNQVKFNDTDALIENFIFNMFLEDLD